MTDSSNDRARHETGPEASGEVGPPPPSAPAAPPVGTPPPAVRTPWLHGRNIAVAALSGVIGVGFAVAAAVLVAVLTVVFALIVGAPNAGGSGSSGDLSLDGLQFGGIPFVGPILWITVLGLFGQLNAGLSVTALGMTGSVQVFASVVPVLVLISAAAGTAWWAFRAERRARTASRGRIWVLGAVSGLTAAVIAILLSIVGRTTVVVGAVASAGFDVSTISLASFFGPLVVVALSAVVGSWLARGPAVRHFGAALWHAPSRFRWGTRDVYDYLVVLAIVFVPTSLVAAFVAGDGVAAAWPGGIGLFAVATAAIGHLGGYVASTSLPMSSSQGSLLSLFASDLNPLAWLLLLLALLSAVAASILIARRRTRFPVPLARFWVLPVLVLAASVVLGLAVGSAYAFGSASAIGANVLLSASIAPAWWTYLVAVAWGGLVEGSTRFVAPALIATWPALGRLRVAGDGATSGAPIASAAASGDVAPAVGAAPGVPAQPLSPGAKRGLIIGSIVAGSLIVVGIAGGVAITVLQNTVFSPKAVVQTYVDDIAAGSFSRAWQASGGSAEDTGAELVSADQVDLTSAIRDVTLGEVTGTGETRSVPVTFVLDGTTDNAAVTVRSVGKQFLFFDVWAVSEGLDVPVDVYARSVSAISIGGVSVGLSDDGGTVRAYPGVYPVAGPDSKWVTVDAEPLSVSTAGASLSVVAEPSEALTAEVQRQVNAVIDTCAQSTAAAPEDCPFSAYVGTEVRNLTWTVVDYPEVEVTALDSFSGSGGRVSAAYERKSYFGDDWTADDSTDSIWVFGSIEIDGDEVTIAFD